MRERNTLGVLLCHPHIKNFSGTFKPETKQKQTDRKNFKPEETETDRQADRKPLYQTKRQTNKTTETFTHRQKTFKQEEQRQKQTQTDRLTTNTHIQTAGPSCMHNNIQTDKYTDTTKNRKQWNAATNYTNERKAMRRDGQR